MSVRTLIITDVRGFCFVCDWSCEWISSVCHCKVRRCLSVFSLMRVFVSGMWRMESAWRLYLHTPTPSLPYVHSFMLPTWLWILRTAWKIFHECELRKSVFIEAERQSTACCELSDVW